MKTLQQNHYHIYMKLYSYYTLFLPIPPQINSQKSPQLPITTYQGLITLDLEQGSLVLPLEEAGSFEKVIISKTRNYTRQRPCIFIYLFQSTAIGSSKLQKGEEKLKELNFAWKNF